MASGPVKSQFEVRFGEDFELDFHNYKLRRAGRVLKIERIPLEILFLLIEHSPAIISREEIVERVWGKNVFLDTDNSINGAIRKIRQVLRDDAEQPRFIQTITGQGYRFIGTVVQVPQAEAPEFEEQARAPLEQAKPSIVLPAVQEPEPHPAPRRRRWLIAVTVAAVVTACLGTSLLLFRNRRSVPGRAMVAVLPLQNLTGDARDDYFSDGLTEELITRLSNVDPQNLRVIARTSVMRYKGSTVSVDQVGRALGADYVIEGSVRRDGTDVRITAQLIQTKDQSHLWAQQYDRELTGLLRLEGEIAEKIADQIQVTLGKRKSVTARPVNSSENYESYDLYLKGQYFFNKRTSADIEQAISYFQKAIEKDSNSARAYAGLADAYALLCAYSTQSHPEFMVQARAAAVRALQLDESLPEAHTALALIVQNNDWDWQTAEREFRRAIELNPNYATAHHWYAEHLMWQGRFDEALQESERARQLDPLSLIVAADNAAIFFFSRQYDGAIQKWVSVMEMDPNLLRSHLIFGAYTEKGMFAEAFANNEKFRTKISPASYWSTRAFIQGRAGNVSDANRAVEELLRLNQHTQVDPIVIAQAYVALGKKQESLAWLEKAYIRRSNELVSLKVSPFYDSLRSDPQFEDLLVRLRLVK